MVLGFTPTSHEAVDDRHAELTAAGFEARSRRFDALWGAQYAIVADANGNDVGLICQFVSIEDLPTLPAYERNPQLTFDRCRGKYGSGRVFIDPVGHPFCIVFGRHSAG